MWKEHFKNLLGNSPKVTNKLIIIINNQLDIKPGQFTQEKLNEVQKNKNRKAGGLDEILREV